MKPEIRLAVVQLAGDYREAAQNFAAGKDETYYAQQYSVDSIAALRQQFDQVTVICALTATAYDELLPNGVRAIGAGFKDRFSHQQLIRLLEAQQPTHLILRIPSPTILRWAAKRQINTLVMLAESILADGLRSRIRNFFLTRSLNQPQVKWVGSYGISSARRLQQLGVDARKIVPWDFLLDAAPGDLQPKSLPQAGKTWTLLYVGLMMAAKGVGDILDAVAQLRSRQIPVKLQLVGKDSAGEFARQAQELQISPFVEFLGLVPNHRIEPLMHDADVVLIPSHHRYGEGFPLTIHHALRSRTPLVASDHPMFLAHLKPQVNAMIFPAQNAAALANAVEQLLSDPSLYHRLSEASYDTWQQLRLPIKWADLIAGWLDDSSDRLWRLQDYTLASGYYEATSSGTLGAIAGEISASALSQTQILSQP